MCVAIAVLWMLCSRMLRCNWCCANAVLQTVCLRCWCCKFGICELRVAHVDVADVVLSMLCMWLICANLNCVAFVYTKLRTFDIRRLLSRLLPNHVHYVQIDHRTVPLHVKTILGNSIKFILQEQLNSLRSWNNSVCRAVRSLAWKFSLGLLGHFLALEKCKLNSMSWPTCMNAENIERLAFCKWRLLINGVAAY